MVRIAAVIALISGAVSAAGGLQGYLAKKSVPSLAGGVGLGILLIAGGLLTLKGRGWAPGLSLVAAILLAGRFVPAFVKNPSNLWPALVMAALAVLTAAAQLLVMLRKG